MTARCPLIKPPVPENRSLNSPMRAWTSLSVSSIMARMLHPEDPDSDPSWSFQLLWHTHDCFTRRSLGSLFRFFHSSIKASATHVCGLDLQALYFDAFNLHFESSRPVVPKQWHIVESHN